MLRSCHGRRVKAETGEITPLQDVTSEHLELRAGSGLKAANAMDVGVRAPGSTGPPVGKSPRNRRGCAGALRLARAGFKAGAYANQEEEP